MKNLKKIICVCLVCIVCCTLCSCGKPSKKDLPQYPSQEFEICGLWAPHQITEEAFLQYKNAGFNVLSFTNHDAQPRSSENQYYIGSKRTLEALKLCEKIGIDAYIAYGASWFNRANEGDEYFDNKPFSTYDQYGEYKDIIKGVHINDEPNKETMEQLAKDELIDDFKKVFPKAKYMINLIPATAVTSRDFADYDEMMKIYGETIMSKFETPYVCVDVYPFSNSKNPENMIVYNYNEIAKAAKKYDAETTMILQSSTGSEFKEALSEADMRWQAYLAIAFGADNLQYYCYSVPTYYSEDGSTIEGYLYDHCILNQDGTPNQLYYDLKTVNQEIQKFASVALAYDWEEAIAITGTVDQTFRANVLQYDENFDPRKLSNPKHYVSATATQDLVISQFKSEKYGEAYMLVNFARAESDNNTVNLTFKDCKAIAIYGGEGYSGTPEIAELDENGNVAIELNYGEGVFVTPIV